MALWGNLDNKGAGGKVSLNYNNLTVTGTATTFGQVGAAATGDVIRFGVKGNGGVYFGEAVILGITSATVLTIDSTAALTGTAIASTSFQISQLPKYLIKDKRYQHKTADYDSYVYGVAEGGADAAQTTSYALTHEGWVGIMTYIDSSGNLRVKNETLVAMSGVSTGNTPTYPPA